MYNKKIYFLFPSPIYSGHEKMAFKIFKKSPYKVECILNKKLLNHIELNESYLQYDNIFKLITTLISIRFTKKKVTIVLVAGSPFGFIIEKFILKCLAFNLIEYVPFPELKQMHDRFHHRFVPIINYILINKRVLIDDWQRNENKIQNNVVIKNYVENA
jgi:hypothetical protein